MAGKIHNIYKPSECMQYMNVEIHPNLLEAWYSSNISEEVTSSGARVTSARDLCDAALIVWSRRLPPELANKDGQVQLKSKEECEHALYVMYVDDLISHVADRTLAAHVGRIKDMSGRKLTLVLFGTADYFKGSSRRKTSNSKANMMSVIDLEMALTDLLVSAECDAVKLDTPYELAGVVVQMTKAVATAPFKKSKRDADEQAQFYMRGDNKKCVGVNKEGHGAGRVWQQMVAMLPHASLETSRALCAQYKTPRELYQALSAAGGLSSVADTRVARSAAPGTRARRAGGELARKLHALLTADAGHTLLD